MRRRRVYELRPWPPRPVRRLSLWERPLFVRQSQWLAFQVRSFWAWDPRSGLSRRAFQRSRERSVAFLQVLALGLVVLALRALFGS